ncbi:hypothetical protein U9M48_030539 [Paspalum notatum var. saurae]|uniref:Uncharacterized protein n=1 Tax=Paspalum notatum var. saurae TaxID=547442 RepID=A0AAQ3X3C6_PASNO
MKMDFSLIMNAALDTRGLIEDPRKSNLHRAHGPETWESTNGTGRDDDGVDVSSMFVVPEHVDAFLRELAALATASAAEAACKAKWAFMRASHRPRALPHIRATGAPSVTASALRRLGCATGHRHPLPPLLADARHRKVVPLKQALFFEGLHIIQSLLAHPRPKPTLVQHQGFCRVLHRYGTFQMSGLIVSAPRMQSYKSMMARSPYLRKKIVFAELAVDTYPDAEVKGPVLAVSSSVVECPLSELCLPHPAMTNDGDDLSVTTSESGHEMAVLVFIPEELAAPSEWSRGGPWFGSDHELRDLEEIPRVRVQLCQQSLQLPQRLPAANN